MNLVKISIRSKNVNDNNMKKGFYVDEAKSSLWKYLKTILYIFSLHLSCRRAAETSLKKILAQPTTTN